MLEVFVELLGNEVVVYRPGTPDIATAPQGRAGHPTQRAVAVHGE